MRDDLYINTKEWQNSSDDWVKTMTKSKENKERYQEYRRTTNNPLIYVEWLKRYER
tara:strand:+ start:535 stop:702 length:168 start_codon:yes stop_codon:yes gene_type:complete